MGISTDGGTGRQADPNTPEDAVIEEEDLDHLARICGRFGSNSMDERATAAAEATSLIADMGLTWRQFIGARRDRHEEDDDALDHIFTGFVPFAGSNQSTALEARGYLRLMNGTRDENRVLRRIVGKDVRFHELDDDEHALMKHLRNEARELRDMFAGQVFMLKSGRKCRLVSV